MKFLIFFLFFINIIGLSYSEDLEKFDINEATKEELISISGIGESTAYNIKESRPFCKYEELLDVSGIGESTLSNIKEASYIDCDNLETEDKEESKDSETSSDDNKETEEADENNESKKESDKIDKFDINEATKEDLILISGIGESTAQNIKENRPFCEYEELLDVSGVGESTLSNIKEASYIDCENTDNDQEKDEEEKNNESKDEFQDNIDESDKDTDKIDKDSEEEKDYCPSEEIFTMLELNSASKDELTTLPGVGGGTAQNIIDYRLENYFCQTQDILEVSGIGQSRYQEFIDNNLIYVNPADECFELDSTQDKIDNGKLQITEIHLEDDSLPNYIQIKSLNGPYKGELEIKGLGRGSASREIEINLFSGASLVLADSYSGFQNTSLVNIIDDGVYLSNAGQKLYLVGQNGQIMDKAKYSQTESGKSNYFDKEINGYRRFHNINYPTPGFSSSDLNYFFDKELDNIDSPCPYSLDINFQDNFFTGSLSYQIDTNADDFEITYWIQTWDGKKLFSPRKSKNTNTRNFTPRLNNSEVLEIFAKLDTDKCEKTKSKKITFMTVNKTKNNFNILYDKISDAGYLIEDDFSIRVPRTQKTYKDLYEKLISNIEDENYSVTRTTAKLSGGNGQASTNSRPALNGEIIDLNSSYKNQLTSLTGIGDSTAQSIIDARHFCSYSDLLEVSGIGQNRKESLKLNDNVIISIDESCFENKENYSTGDKQGSQQEKKFIEINTSSKPQLKTISGIGETTAQSIIDARPFCNFDELNQVSGIGETTVSKLINSPYIFLHSPKSCFQDLQDDKEDKEKTDSEFIELNTASTGDLQKIDRVGQSLAKSITKARPICSKQDLLEISGIGENLANNIISQPNILIDTIGHCESKNKNQGRPGNGEIKIIEINPNDDILPQYIQIKSKNGAYKGEIKIKGLGRGSASRKFDINVGSGQKLTITDTNYGLPHNIKTKLLPSIYLTKAGQKLELIGQDGQVVDRVVYKSSNSHQSLAYNGQNSDGYRLFDKQIDFWKGEYELPEMIDNSIAKIDELDKKLLSIDERYQRAREYRSACVSDRDSYLDQLRLHRNYANIVNRKLRSDWYLVFQESGIEEYYDIYDKQLENLQNGYDLVNIKGIKTRPYNISHIYHINNYDLSSLPDRYQDQFLNFYKESIWEASKSSFYYLYSSNKKSLISLFNNDVLNIEGLLWPQESMRGDLADMSS